MRITIMGEASEFFVTGHCSDPVIDSKVCPTRNHAAVFIERHAFSESIAVAVAVVITAVPKLFSAETIDTTSGGYGLTFLGIELAWVIFGIPLLVYIGWNVIASMMESQASTMTTQGPMSGDSINLTIYEGSPEKADMYREVMGVGKVSNPRKNFFFGFCLNAAIIAYQILHGIMKGESNIMSGIMSCSLFWSDKSMKVFFGAKALIDTGFKSVNFLLALAEYALVVAIPIVLLKLTKKRAGLQRKVVTAFWGLLFGLLLAQLPTLLAWLAAKDTSCNPWRDDRA